MISKLKLIIFAVTLVVSACSARVLGLKYADKLALHQLDRMFDLTGEQEDQFEPVVKAEVERLKRERLPRVIAAIEEYGRAWDRGPTETDAIRVVDEYDAIRDALAAELGGVAAKFLAGLSAEQIAHLEERLAESNEKGDELLKKEPEEFVAKRRKSTLKNFEHWLGSVPDEQEAKLLELAPPDRAEFERYRAERLASQKAFLGLLKSKPSEAEIRAKIVEWTKEPWKMRGTTPEEGQRRRRKMIRILSSTHALASPEQRRHVKEEIGDLVDDLKSVLK